MLRSTVGVSVRPLSRVTAERRSPSVRADETGPRRDSHPLQSSSGRRRRCRWPPGSEVAPWLVHRRASLRGELPDRPSGRDVSHTVRTEMRRAVRGDRRDRRGSRCVRPTQTSPAYCRDRCSTPGPPERRSAAGGSLTWSEVASSRRRPGQPATTRSRRPERRPGPGTEDHRVDRGPVDQPGQRHETLGRP